MAGSHRLKGTDFQLWICELQDLGQFLGLSVPQFPSLGVEIEQGLPVAFVRSVGCSTSAPQEMRRALGGGVICLLFWFQGAPGDFGPWVRMEHHPSPTPPGSSVASPGCPLGPGSPELLLGRAHGSPRDSGRAKATPFPSDSRDLADAQGPVLGTMGVQTARPVLVPGQTRTSLRQLV